MNMLGRSSNRARRTMHAAHSVMHRGSAKRHTIAGSASTMHTTASISVRADQV